MRRKGAHPLGDRLPVLYRDDWIGLDRPEDLVDEVEYDLTRAPTPGEGFLPEFIPFTDIVDEIRCRTPPSIDRLLRVRHDTGGPRASLGEDPVGQGLERCPLFDRGVLELVEE